MILADLEPDTKLIPASGKVAFGNPMPPETDANLTIGDPMPWVLDSNLGIKSL